MHANEPEMAKKWEKEEESVDEEKKRDYKAEYKKFQSSTKAKKYRAELNQYNRKKGTYGNGDGKDASHKGGKIVGFEKESTNRGRAEKSRLKKEAISRDEWAQYPKYARKLKPYLQKLFKVPLRVKVIKQANHNPWIDVRVARFGKDIIPNDFRKKAAKVIGASGVRDWDNVNYGNIRVNSISLKADDWKKLLGNKVKSESVNEIMAGSQIPKTPTKKLVKIYKQMADERLSSGAALIFRMIAKELIKRKAKLEGGKDCCGNCKEGKECCSEESVNEEVLQKLQEREWSVLGTQKRFKDADYEREFKKLRKGYYVVGYLGGLYKIISLKWKKKDNDGDVKLKFVKNLAYKRGHKKTPRSSWDGKVVSWRDIADEQVSILTKEEDYNKQYVNEGKNRYWKAVNRSKRELYFLLTMAKKHGALGKKGSIELSDIVKSLGNLEQYFYKEKTESINEGFDKYHLGNVGDSKLKNRLERAIKIWGGKVDAVGMDTIKFRLSSSDVMKFPALLKKLDRNKNVWIGDKRKNNIWDRKRNINKLGEGLHPYKDFDQQDDKKEYDLNLGAFIDKYQKMMKFMKKYKEVPDKNKRAWATAVRKKVGKSRFNGFIDDWGQIVGYLKSFDSFRSKKDPHAWDIKGESIDEGFGSPELMGEKDLAKFEKTRQKNAEVLGYKLTGRPDHKPMKEKTKVTSNK